MKNYKKISTVILAVTIMLLHTATMSLAATSYKFNNVLMPNWREVVTLGKGSKGTNDLYSKVRVTDGSVNYIYASAYYNNSNIVEDDEVMISNGTSTYTKLWYKNSYNNVKKGEAITIKAYQKNVAAKTATGNVIY